MKFYEVLDSSGFIRLRDASELTILVGFYRGITPGVTGSLATGATYFGVIESTKQWIEESHPNLGGHWAHFIAGAVGKLFFLVFLKSNLASTHKGAI